MQFKQLTKIPLIIKNISLFYVFIFGLLFVFLEVFINGQFRQNSQIINTNYEFFISYIEGPMTKKDFEASAMKIGSTISSKKMLKNYNYGGLIKINLQDLNSVNDLINSLGKSKGGFND